MVCNQEGSHEASVKGHSQSSGVELQRGWGLSGVLEDEDDFNNGEENQAFFSACSKTGD